ncbi:MAG: hypothetical protein VYE18_01770 [Pseudomonadota bacterium]|nr:hypothetical protein [Pseudomonadota bacterium]
MRRIFLITSGAYVGPEFASEFGQIPPTFLPVGNRRLYEHQANWAAEFEGRRLISLPGNFGLPELDKERLLVLGFEIITVPPGLTLAQSILHVLSEADIAGRALRILHGDTLVGGIDLDADDVVSEGVTTSYHSWAEYERGENGIRFFDGLPSGAGERNVLSGYFSFADAERYMAALKVSETGFVGALNHYGADRNLSIVGGGQWLDFGHIELYHQSVAQMPTMRAFNRLDISHSTVTKSSNDEFQMDAEAGWFERVPEALRIFLPKYLGRERGGGYITEYLYLSTLSDLYVFGRLPGYVWRHIFQSCADFLGLCAEFTPARDEAPGRADIYFFKTQERLRAFAAATSTNLEKPWRYGDRNLPGLLAIAEENFAEIPAAPANDHCVMHGDFCFSNIFYDFRAGAIRTVDPRGHMNGQVPSIFGDLRYDLAKLYHSVIGGYDFITAGRYRLRDDGGHSLAIDIPELAVNQHVMAAFLDTDFVGRQPGGAATKAIAVLLYLSMLPLHGDDPVRQRALLANALRLHAAAEEPSL